MTIGLGDAVTERQRSSLAYDRSRGDLRSPSFSPTRYGEKVMGVSASPKPMSGAHRLTRDRGRDRGRVIGEKERKINFILLPGGILWYI